MTYKVSMTTRITVTADTPDEVRRICDGFLPSRAVQFEPGGVTNVPALEAGSTPPEAESEPPAPPPGEAEQAQAAPDGQADGQPLAEAIECYLGTLAASGRASTTLATYRMVLGPLVKRLGASYPVGQITTADLIDYLAFLNTKGLAQASAKLYGRICKGFFRWLAESEIIQASPMKAINLLAPRWNPAPPSPMMNSDDSWKPALRRWKGP